MLRAGGLPQLKIKQFLGVLVSSFLGFFVDSFQSFTTSKIQDFIQCFLGNNDPILENPHFIF